MIPQIIHQVWFGGEVPERFKPYMEGWKQNHPDCEYTLWTDENIPPLRNQLLFDQAEELAPGNVGQFKADIARYELLYQFGGVYVDVDFESLKPLDPLLKPSTELFAAWEVQNVWINNAIMGAEVGNPFLGTLIDCMAANVALHRGKKPNVLTGPQYLTQLVERVKPEITIFDKQLFYPYLYTELNKGSQKWPLAYAVHHWNNRRTNGRTTKHPVLGSSVRKGK